MKKKGNISIKAKLLGIIIPVVIAIILILVFTAYHVKIAKFNSTIHLYSGILFCTSGV